MDAVIISDFDNNAIVPAVTVRSLIMPAVTVRIPMPEGAAVPAQPIGDAISKTLSALLATSTLIEIERAQRQVN